MDRDTYLTCTADLWKHTSGWSANMSRLYCPLTSAELLIVNATTLRRRALTVDWGSLSLTSWLTAANTPLDLPSDKTHKHNTPMSLRPEDVWYFLSGVGPHTQGQDGCTISFCSHFLDGAWENKYRTWEQELNAMQSLKKKKHNVCLISELNSYLL